jgi:ribonuclease HIII
MLAAKLEERLDHRLKVLMPEAYNLEYAAAGNLNDLLANMHAECLAELSAANSDTEELVVDKFANERLLLGRLSKVISSGPKLTQVTRAERHPAVAAASIIARAAFLNGLRESSELCGSDLAKGAGTPVDVAAKRVYEIGGMKLLSQVAKVHFKNTDKIPGVGR